MFFHHPSRKTTVSKLLKTHLSLFCHITPTQTANGVRVGREQLCTGTKCIRAMFGGIYSVVALPQTFLPPPRTFLPPDATSASQMGGWRVHTKRTEEARRGNATNPG
jgi:hypothetical protein